ncbi:MAG: hypothetical protein F6K14_34320 [Symploca sp. SIO2C1]|nr:hypothetical protein [Symploca sp. SIO2C1]
MKNPPYFSRGSTSTEDPTAPIRAHTVWVDLQDFSAEEELPQQVSLPSFLPVLSNPPPQIVEATGWIVNAQGNVELVANLPDGTLIGSTARQSKCMNSN